MEFCVSKNGIFVEQEVYPVFFKEVQILDEGVFLWVLIGNDFYDAFVEHMKYILRNTKELWIEGKAPEYQIFYGKTEKEKVKVGELFPYSEGNCAMRLDLSLLKSLVKDEILKFEILEFKISC